MIKRTCAVDDCDRPSRKRGWCDNHYKRWRKYGDVSYPDRSSVERKFLMKVARANGCWTWTGAMGSSGYGSIRWEGRTSAPHIVAYILEHGTIPDGLVVDHTCHNVDPECAGGTSCLHRRCVNPAHLEAVPFGTNVRRGKGPAGIASRKTACPQGHDYTQENTTVYRGKRYCRECQGARRRRRYAERGV